MKFCRGGWGGGGGGGGSVLQTQLILLRPEGQEAYLTYTGNLCWGCCGGLGGSGGVGVVGV